MTSSQLQQARDLFLEIIDLPAEDRAARLALRCADDAELHARVEALLQADADNAAVGSVLEQPLIEIEGASEPIPKQVGTYVIRAVAGAGGMGAVFDGLHEPTRRRAAVKLLRAGVASERGRERFRIEAESLARLSDPGIAQVFDAGVAEVVYADGTRVKRPFIAMEFVDGRPIVEFARAAELRVADRLRLIERVLRAVHHAHQRAVIHRDLKPGNMLVTREGTPKIVDFGIARLIDATHGGVTDVGQMIGTVRYKSPEQVAGDSGSIDTRTDVYSVGAILYELLAERPLVPIDTGASLGAAIQVLQLTPDRLSKIRPDLAGDIDAIVHKAIEREPEARYGSAAVFADDLQRFLEGREVSARAPGAVERFVRIVKRNKARVALVAVIAISLLGGIVGTSWGLVRAERARRAEAEQRRVAESAEADSNAFSNFLVNRVLATARPKDMQQGLGVDVTVVDALREAEKHLDSDFAGRPAAEAIARRAIGVTWRYLGEFDKAEAHIRRAVEVAETALGPAHETTLDIRNSQLVLLQQMERNADGIAVQQQIVKGLDAALGPHSRRTLSARYNLAIYRAKTADYATALKELEAVHADRASALGADDVETLTTLSDIAELRMLLGDAERAVQIQEDLNAKLRTRFGDDNPQTLSAQYRLAILLQHQGQHERAAKLLEEVLPKLRQSLGNQHVTTLDAVARLFVGYVALEKFDQAAVLAREYADGQAKLLGERSSQLALILSSTAGRFLAAKQYRLSEEFARRSLALYQEIAPDSAAYFESQCFLGESLAAQNRLSEAEPLLTSGLAGLDRQPKLSRRHKDRQHPAREALMRIQQSTGRGPATRP